MPSPAKFFPEVTLSPEEDEKLLVVKHQALKENLEEYEQFLRRTFDFSQWKTLKEVGALCAFQHKKPGKSSLRHDISIKSRLPSLLIVGSMEGSLHDMLYGTLANTRAERMLRSAYTQDGVYDATVLYTLQKPTKKNPFRSTTVKWSLKKTPTSNMIIRDRDFCFLAATGIMRTPWNERVGFELRHSVDFPTCPAYDGKEVVRAKLFVCTFYREAKAEPGVVEVFTKAVYDPSGDWLPFWAARATAETLLKSTSKIVECSYAKKLWRALEQNACKFDHQALAASASSAALIKSTCECYLCQKRIISGRSGSGSGTAASRGHQCALCDKWVCTACLYQKTLFMAGQEELFQQGHSECVGFMHRKKKFGFCMQCFMEVRGRDAAELAWEEAELREQLEEEDLESSFSTSSSWSVLDNSNNSIQLIEPLSSSLSLGSSTMADVD